MDHRSALRRTRSLLLRQLQENFIEGGLNPAEARAAAKRAAQVVPSPLASAEEVADAKRVSGDRRARLDSVEPAKWAPAGDALASRSRHKRERRTDNGV